MPAIQSYYLTLTGTPYENGTAKGAFVRNNITLYANLRDRLAWFDAYDKEAIDAEGVERCEQIVAQRLPVLFDEIRGFSDALEIPYRQYLPYFLFDWEITSHCSQFCVLPDITRDGKVYSGHSWEWTMEANRGNRLQTLEEDNLYVVAKNSQAGVMGFALNYFGMWNGMNAYGVSVNPTGGVPLNAPPPARKLYNHGLLVRLILETCRSADEGLALVRELIPLSSGVGGGTLIITDSSGRSYYIERANRHFAAVEVGKDTDLKYQCAANHFVLPQMYPYASQKGVHSIVRQRALSQWIAARSPDITMETLKTMQEQPIPNGPCCHHYAAYLGTVRSMVYNLTDLTAMISYGSPRLNPWHAYDFSVAKTDMQIIETQYVNEEADPIIWKHIPPDEEYEF